MATILDCSAEFISHCCYEKKLSVKTKKCYEIDLKQFLEFLKEENHPLAIEAIDKEALRNYVRHISSFKPKTIKRKLATLKAFFNYLEFDDRIVVNPFRKIRFKIKESKRLPTVMSVSEITKIFKIACAQTENKNCTTHFQKFEAIRNLAVIEMLFATGVRVSELSGLNKDCVNLQEGFLRVVGKGDKERVIQICNQETLSVLKEYSKYFQAFAVKTQDYFFINRLYKRLSTQSIRQIVKDLCIAAGLNKPITPHVFRHSVATLLLEEGVDIKYIQDILGHSSIVTTQIYTHVSGEKQKAILNLSHPRKKITIGITTSE